MSTPSKQNQDNRSRYQQNCFNDLYPSGCFHTAENNIGQHQNTYGNNGYFILNTDQGFNQNATADHLCSQVESGYSNSRDSCNNFGRFWIVTESQNVTEGIFTNVTAGFSNNQQYSDISHQPAYGVHETIITIEGNQTCDTQEGSSRQVVTGNCPTVLDTCNGTTSRIEVCSRSSLFSSTISNVHS